MANYYLVGEKYELHGIFVSPRGRKNHFYVFLPEHKSLHRIPGREGRLVYKVRFASFCQSGGVWCGTTIATGRNKRIASFQPSSIILGGIEIEDILNQLEHLGGHADSLGLSVHPVNQEEQQRWEELKRRRQEDLERIMFREEKRLSTYIIAGDKDFCRILGVRSKEKIGEAVKWLEAAAIGDQAKRYGQKPNEIMFLRSWLEEIKSRLRV